MVTVTLQTTTTSAADRNLGVFSVYTTCAKWWLDMPASICAKCEIVFTYIDGGKEKMFSIVIENNRVYFNGGGALVCISNVVTAFPPPTVLETLGCFSSDVTAMSIAYWSKCSSLGGAITCPIKDDVTHVVMFNGCSRKKEPVLQHVQFSKLVMAK